MATRQLQIHVPTWLHHNKEEFRPPVCNKMMHKEGQIQMFLVGGPNQRKDYHLEEGEELFFMIKGDMVLKVKEGGQPRDILIREGELLLLPGNTYHSPQREADTVGLVIERERDADEMDGVVYFVEAEGEPTEEHLYEAWFHCEDLGLQLAPLICDYFSSEQHRTGRPLPDTISSTPPCLVNSSLRMPQPVSLSSLVLLHRTALTNSPGVVSVLGERNQISVQLLGHCDMQSKTERRFTTGASSLGVPPERKSWHCRFVCLAASLQEVLLRHHSRWPHTTYHSMADTTPHIRVNFSCPTAGQLPDRWG